MGYWYDLSYNLFQSVFFIVVPVMMFLILVLLYQNFYGKDQKKPRLISLYTKTMIWALSFLVVIMLAKIWDDMIDKNYMSKYDALNQEQNYYVDMYSCNQKFGIYDYNVEIQPNNSTLTKEQIETCRVEQIERQQNYSDLDKNNVFYKWVYRLWFLVLLLLIHIGIYYASRSKKD